MSLRECASCTTAYAADLRACPQCQCTDVAGAPSPVLSLPMVTVECTLAFCPDAGKRREVRLKSAAPGVLESPPLRCARCWSHMLIVKPWPLPGGEDMAKISRHGGPTNAREPKPIPPAEPVTGADATAATLTVDLTEPREHPGTGEPMEGVEMPADGVEREIGTSTTGEGGEEPSPGSSSSTSPTKPPPTPKPKDQAPRRRARPTGSRSRKARTDSSSASSTDGAPTAGTSEPDEGAG